VTRERLARVALLAYPRGVRAAKGEEMIGTLLDASGQSTARYGRELAAPVSYTHLDVYKRQPSASAVSSER